MISIELARVLFSKAKTLIFDFIKFDSEIELLSMLIWETRKQFKSIIVLSPYVIGFDSIEQVIVI